jgi:hypothetical protein
MAVAFKTELQAMQQLLTQQSSVLAGHQLAKLMAIQANAFTCKADALRGLETADVAELTTIIHAGPWNSEQQGNLVMALAKSMCDAGDASGNADRRKAQELCHFFNYTTESDNKIITGDCMRSKITVALDICARINAVLLRETSKRHILSAICSLHARPTGWNVKELRAWYLHFKKEYTSRFKGRTADKDIGHIVKFPEKPSMLPGDKYTIMYKGVDAVGFEVSPDVVAKIESAIWCRGNAVALRDENEIVVAGSDLHRRSSKSASSSTPDVNQMMMMMMNMMQRQQRHHQPHEDDLIELLPPAPKRRPIASPQTGQPTRAESMLSLSEEPTAIEDGPVPQAAPITPKAPATHEQALASVPTKKAMSPHEQAAKFLDSLKGAANDDDDDDDGEDSDKGGTRPIKARPAAKGNMVKPKTKAKAAAKGKAKAMTPKLPVTGWSLARRMKEYPKGCAKCREAPGCTASCFKQRGQIK